MCLGGVINQDDQKVKLEGELIYQPRSPASGTSATVFLKPLMCWKTGHNSTKLKTQLEDEQTLV